MELDLGNDGEKIKNLISKPEISGKEIDFDEFKDIMNTGKEEKINCLFFHKQYNHIHRKLDEIYKITSRNIK